MEPLFVKLDGSPVFAKDMVNILKQLVLFLNLPHNLIKLHSFRIGGIDTFASQGTAT